MLLWCNLSLSSEAANQELSKSHLIDYIKDIQYKFEKSPYTATQGFLKNQFEKYTEWEEKNLKTYLAEESSSFREKFPPISYEENNDEKNLDTFIEEVLPSGTVMGKKLSDSLSPLITKEVKASILTMMQRERENKGFVPIYHATRSIFAIMTEFYTELYRALGILEGEDKQHKILRPFADIFNSVKTTADLRRIYCDDSKPEFSKRCLSCVPYIFGFLTSDTPPIVFWLANLSWKANANFMDEINKISQTLKVSLSTEKYQEILNSHKVTDWGGIMMQIMLSPEDLITLHLKEKYGYMCYIYGHTWFHETWQTDLNDPRRKEIDCNVLETTLKTRQGQKLDYVHLHQLRYMPKEIPAAVYFHYARQHDLSKIEAFREALFNQIKEDIKNININFLLSQALLFPPPQL